jgi:hypothetical protein
MDAGFCAGRITETAQWLSDPVPHGALSTLEAAMNTPGGRVLTQLDVQIPWPSGKFLSSTWQGGIVLDLEAAPP